MYERGGVFLDGPGVHFNFFMMQYAMLITLHIPKWKNCFFKKKGPNTIDYTQSVYFCVIFKIQIKKKNPVNIILISV